MAKVKIISIPPGQAPEWVRAQWVGIELPTDDTTQQGFQCGALGGSAQNRGGYKVETQLAINALKEKGGEAGSAAQWWEDNGLARLGTHLVFSREVCELLPTD